jgi:hypothetical protein
LPAGRKHVFTDMARKTCGPPDSEAQGFPQARNLVVER